MRIQIPHRTLTQILRSWQAGQASAISPTAFLLATTISLCLVGAALATPTRGGTIDVWACHQPNGATAPLDHWSSSLTSAAGLDAYNDCAASSGLTVFGATANIATYPANEWAAWTFTAPPATSVQELTYTRVASLNGGAAFALLSGQNGVWDRAHAKESCETTSGCTLLNWTTSTFTFSDADGARIVVEPCSAGGNCNGAWGLFQVSSAGVVLLDSSGPTFSTLTGALASGAPLHGNASLSVQLADTGVGLYKLHATVDGVSFDDRTLDTNGGKCVPVIAATREFNYAVPCPLNLSANTSLNTATLLDGTHSVDVKVEDAAGNLTTVFHDKVTTHNAVAGKPKIELKIAPTHTANRHTIHWKGRVFGDSLPRHGGTVLAQVKQGKGWIVFRQIPLDSKGRFKFDYRFHATTVATTYTFRVALARTGRYSLGHAHSNIVKVHVRP